MEKRRLNRLGIETSLLGFGCMRFPMKDGKIDEVEAERMLDFAISKGVNYIDTAYPYHNGESEPFVGKVLNKYPRESYYLATKLPMWLIQNVEDAKRIFKEQLQRLHTEYIDFYLLHALNQESFQKAVDEGIIAYCEELQKQGKIKYFGFSFHDDYEVFEKIITYRLWDFCQIQLNYVDTKEQAGEKGYDLAKKLGIPVVIMEPLKGGRLARFSEDINEIFREMDETASIASFGMRWLASHDNVKVILSGMSTWDQVEDNLNTFCHYKPMNETEKATLDKVNQILKARVQNGCTGCQYCMPCPVGVDIPSNFSVWNDYHIYQNYDFVSWEWEKNILTQNKQADLCVKCGKCETKCPQKLKIREDLMKVTEDFNKRRY